MTADERPRMSFRDRNFPAELTFSWVAREWNRTSVKTGAVRREAPGRLFVAAASWASVCLIRTWVVLHQSASVYAFWHQANRRRVDYLASTSAWLILALLLWGAFLVSTGEKHLRFARLLAEAFLLIVACITVNQVRITLLDDLVAISRAAIVLSVPAVWFVVRRRRTIGRACRTVLVCLFPFVAWILGGAVYASLHISPSMTVPGRAPAGQAKVMRNAGGAGPGSRIVWVIFDEWDGALTFDRRIPGLSLPTVDEFRATAFFASAAQAPANRTLKSLPSFLLGKQIVDAHASDTADSAVKLAIGRSDIDFQRSPNLIQRLSDRSIRVGIAGWYLPYERLFGDSLAASYSVPYGPNLPPTEGWAPSTAMDLYGILPNLARTGLGIGSEAEAHRVVYDRIMPVAERYAADASLDFVFLHLPIPHLPAIYDRSAGQLRTSSYGLTYEDNLALLDRSLHRLQTAMQKAGVWDDSTVLLSSDHWARATHHYPGELYNKVPFLLKLKGRSGRVEYQHQFNTVLTGALLLAVIDGRVTTPESVGTWLDEHR